MSINDILSNKSNVYLSYAADDEFLSKYIEDGIELPISMVANKTMILGMGGNIEVSSSEMKEHANNARKIIILSLPIKYLIEGDITQGYKAFFYRHNASECIRPDFIFGIYDTEANTLYRNNNYYENYDEFKQKELLLSVEEKAKETNLQTKAYEKYKDVIDVPALMQEMNLLTPQKQEYIFESDFMGPRYIIAVTGNQVEFIYKEADFTTVMHSTNDKMDFIKKIKSMDEVEFNRIYQSNPIIKKYIDVLNLNFGGRTSFDRKMDQEIDSLSAMLNSLDHDSHKYTIDKPYSFDFKNVPVFNKNTSIDIIVRKLLAYYTAFTNNIDVASKSEYLHDRAEYIVESYLEKYVSNTLKNYMHASLQAINSGIEPEIDSHFLTNDIDMLLDNVKKSLSSIEKSNDIEDFIDITIELLRNQLRDYEEQVNRYIYEELEKEHFAKKNVEIMQHV